MVTVERIREVLSFEPLTGVFSWKVAPTRSVKVGDVAGNRNARGYIAIKIDRRLYMAHRLAWLYVTGEWPVAGVDHVNGSKTDNRFENLRQATHSENMRNRGAQKNNACGYKGVYFTKKDKRWVANIWLHGKKKYLGEFSTPEDAHAAYCAAAEKYHGEFARF